MSDDTLEFIPEGEPVEEVTLNNVVFGVDFCVDPDGSLGDIFLMPNPDLMHTNAAKEALHAIKSMLHLLGKDDEVIEIFEKITNDSKVH